MSLLDDVDNVLSDFSERARAVYWNNPTLPTCGEKLSVPVEDATHLLGRMAKVVVGPPIDALSNGFLIHLEKQDSVKLLRCNFRWKDVPAQHHDRVARL